MVNVTAKVKTQSERARENLARVNKIKKPGIRVEPRDDDMRRLLKHPTAGGFRGEGSIEWPDDTFTHRRLKEGSVKLASEEKPVAATPRRRSDEPDAV